MCFIELTASQEDSQSCLYHYSARIQPLMMLSYYENIVLTNAIIMLPIIEISYIAGRASWRPVDTGFGFSRGSKKKT
jgi:hypothetical protein